MIDSENFDKIIAFMLKARIDILHQMKEPLVAMKSPHYEYSVNKEIFILGIKGVSSRNKVVQLLRSDLDIKKLYTIKTLSVEVEKILSEISKLSEDVNEYTRKALCDMLERLTKSKLLRWKLIIPIMNLDLRLSSLTIGNVTFVNSDPNLFKQEIEHIQTKAQTTQEMKNFFVEKIKETFDNRAAAIVQIDAVDYKNAMGIGSIEIENSLNVLRFYSRGTQFNDSLNYRMFIGNLGAIFKGQNRMLLRSISSGSVEGIEIKLEFENTGYLHELIIDEAVVGEMNVLSLETVSKILAKPEDRRTEFEKIIILSISLFGKGMNQDDKIASFLNFITALETLLTNKHEPQKGLLAERVSIIMMIDPKERLDLFNEVERLYQLRSDFLHQGKMEITDAEVSILSYIVFQTILKTIPLINKISNLGDLARELNLIKFSGSSYSTYFKL